MNHGPPCRNANSIVQNCRNRRGSQKFPIDGGNPPFFFGSVKNNRLTIAHNHRAITIRFFQFRSLFDLSTSVVKVEGWRTRFGNTEICEKPGFLTGQTAISEGNLT